MLKLACISKQVKRKNGLNIIYRERKKKRIQGLIQRGGCKYLL